MDINFSRINYNERPTMILKNAGGTPLGVLGYAYGISPDVNYNEVSRLSFTIPAYADGQAVPMYNEVVGLRLIELQDVGQFILDNPQEIDEGVKRIKECNAYSLEYELVRKNITLAEGTYKFFDRLNPSDTLLGQIMQYAEGWSVGTVSESLMNKYRTFDSISDKVYNFMKGTVQTSVGCIFEFDTMNRRINVRDVNETPVLSPIFISNRNLAKKIEIVENTEDMATRISVNGAEGVDIRDVNPTGTNVIIDLGHFMTEENFSQELITRYYAWKKLVNDNRSVFYSASIQYTLKMMQLATAQAELGDLKGEYTALENAQAATIQAISQGLTTQDALDEANANLASKQAEINVKQAEIDGIQDDADSALADMQTIRDACGYEKYFTDDERGAMYPYLIDSDITETSFVASETQTYSGDGITGKIDGETIIFTGNSISSVDVATGSVIYDIRAGSMAIGDVIDANIISAVLELKEDNTFLLTANLSSTELHGETFPSGCATFTGTMGGAGLADGTLAFAIYDGSMYFTLNASEYERRSVAWDLYEYAESLITKISRPSYSFTISSANFLSIEEYQRFRDALRLGRSVLIEVGNDEYIGVSDITSIRELSSSYMDALTIRERADVGYALGHSKILKPIFIGAEYSYEELDSLTLKFGDSFSATDSSFRLVDLMNKSVSMGKNLDVSKYIYSAFKDSGAQTGIKVFMESALDVSKNAILSSTEQAVSWDGAGLRLRKWANAAKTAYEDEQIWMNNNSILMTDNGWETAMMAIGKFHDANLGTQWGIVAPLVVGTLLAGSSLVIESAKKSGDTAVFRMDADGCRLYNADFDIYKGSNQITLNPDIGLAIGKYPLYTVDNDTGERTLNEDNANFYADAEGNLHLRGMLTATALLIESVDASGNVRFEVLDDHISAAITSNTTITGLSSSVSEINHTLNGDGLITKIMTNTSYYSGQSLAQKISEVESAVTPNAIINTVSSSQKFATQESLNFVAQQMITADGVSTVVEQKMLDGGYATKQYVAEQRITATEILNTVRDSNEFASAEEIITASEILATVRNSNEFSTVQQTADAINQKVTRGNLVSIINQTAETVTIDASNIKIGGFTYGNADQGGAVPGALYCGGQLNSGSMTSTGISANADWAFWAGSGAFKVNQAGLMVAENARIKGTLEAGNWTFNSYGATYSIGASYGRIYSDGATMFYDTYGLDAQYGADSTHTTTMYGNYLKLVPAVADCGIVVCNSQTENLGIIDYEDPTLICDGASNSSSWSGSCGNIGTRYYRWDIGWIKLLRTESNYNDSSRTIKHNIRSLNDVGDIIDQLNPVSFVYNWNNDDQVSLGLIVEDTVNILPEICLYDEDDPKNSAINYTGLIPVLLKEIQSLRARVAALEQPTG